MSILGAILKGKKVGQKLLRSSKTGAIKSVKPGVGGLKFSREAFEGMQKSSAEGVRKFGRPHTTKVLSGLKGKASMPDIVRRAGEVERKRKKLKIKRDYSGYEKKK